MRSKSVDDTNDESHDTFSTNMRHLEISHVVFHDDHLWTEGAGAKWRFVKYGLLFTLRLQQQLFQSAETAEGVTGMNVTAFNTISWLPNPAQMMNPHLDTVGLTSTMGGLGIVRPYAPPPVLLNRTAEWLGQKVLSGDYVRFDLDLTRTPFSEAEKVALRALRQRSNTYYRGQSDDSDGHVSENSGRAKPLAIFLSGPDDPMHWHGSAGRWLHDCFYRHRLARMGTASRMHEKPRLTRPKGTELGRYIVSIHVRRYDMPDWNLPPSYYISAVRAIFDATSLSCDNANVVVIGDSQSPALAGLSDAFDCAVLEKRSVMEPEGEPRLDPHAIDDYDQSIDDVDDARRGYVFRDLEILGLSDISIMSNSEFSYLAQSLSSPHSIVLCPPRRPGRWNRGLPCDRTGVPNSIMTNPGQWGEDAVLSSQLREVDGRYVREEIERVWNLRVLDNQHNDRNDMPLWDQQNQGIVLFDAAKEIESSWPDVDRLWTGGSGIYSEL